TSVALAVAALGGFVWLAWYAYSSGTGELPIEEVPIVHADAEPVRVKPEEPGGMDIPHRDKTIYEAMRRNNQGDGLPKVEQLLPEPEEPVNPEEVAGDDANAEELARARQKAMDSAQGGVPVAGSQSQELIQG